ncbi:MAG: hypothetical protein FJX92_04055 [Bacteroidetes bacterium]|nr:hypothetical protein [Bacteroidota bacterium]
MDQPTLSKHGVHPKHEQNSAPAALQPSDPEDPLSEADADKDLIRWEDADERDLRPEWEDPDAPQSL